MNEGVAAEDGPQTHPSHHDVETALQLLASVMESPEQAIIAADREGVIVAWNQGAERVHGYAAHEALGRRLSMIVPPERAEEQDRLLHQVARGEPVPWTDTVRLTKHGTSIEVGLTMSPVRDRAGQVIGAVAIARDISNQRWMASTLESTLKALEAALNAAHETEARGRRFLADAAHQLRSPIAGIQASAETLVRGAPPSKQEVLLTNLLGETSRAARLLKGLLTMARVDQGEARVPRHCDLVSLCSQEADRFCIVAPELEITVRAVTGLPDQCELDTDAVKEILNNLLDNACRHAARSVELLVGTRGDMLEVRIFDDGPGLAEALRDRAFERFVSLDGKGGSGLGLPIARGLARAQGGDLTYEGGAFVLRLRIGPPAGSGPWGGQVAPPVSRG